MTETEGPTTPAEVPPSDHWEWTMEGYVETLAHWLDQARRGCPDPSSPEAPEFAAEYGTVLGLWAMTVGRNERIGYHQVENSILTERANLRRGRSGFTAAAFTSAADWTRLEGLQEWLSDYRMAGRR